MYYEYWGLNRPAFDNVPDPSMYVECHASMENAIAETLFAIEEGDECVAVIVGDVGLGKTMSIRMIIDALDQNKYKIALITNPGISFVQILQEIIGQLTGTQCMEKRKVSLLEIFNQILFSTLNEGRKVLIFIDEANAITPMNLEYLRLLTNMQSDKRNLFTMVLAGQMEFARRLEHPKRANLFQRIGTYSRIDKLDSVDAVKKYVETRMMLAGATKKIFSDDAFEVLWEQSNRGVPRLVNKLSKLCLKAGETNRFDIITGDIVKQIGSRFHKLTGPAVQQRRSRRKNPEQMRPSEIGEEDRKPFENDDFEEVLTNRIMEAETVSNSEEKLPPAEEAEWEESLQRPEADAVSSALLQSPEEPEHASMDSDAEIYIGDVKIKINFPEQIFKQSLSCDREQRFKLAGSIAAETMRKYPDLIASDSTDPVPIWLEIRNFVMNRIGGAGCVR